MGTPEKRVNLLLKQIRAGDEKALEALYTEFGTRFFAIARKYCADISYAEDVLSEVFYELYAKSASNFTEEKNGLNWLYKIIKNKALTYNKRNGIFLEMQEDSFQVQDYLIEEYEDLKKAMESLTDEENQIMRMYFWEGLTFREIAAIIGKKHTTVFYIYKKGLKKIEKYLH